MNKRKQMRVLAVGLLVVSLGNLIDRFVMPIKDFIHGSFYGIGLGLMLLALYRMKYKTSG